MKNTPITTLAASALLALSPLAATVAADAPPVAAAPPMTAADRAAVDKVLADWPERPRLGAQMMMAKYGPPQEVTAEEIIWRNPGPYKRITVTKAEDHHDMPLPHMDFLEHTIDYVVPADKADELMKYDGSCTFDRTRGEMSARCDLEGHNILTLNLAHDIVTGKISAEEARKSFGENVVADMAGKYPPLTTALRFEVPKTAFADPGVPSIPGSPKRAVKATADTKGAAVNEAKVSGDAEVLATVIAVNTNEIIAAMQVAQRKVSPAVAEYAKMLHAAHGKNSADAMKLALKLDVTPMNTTMVDKLQRKGAAELATLLPLGDAEFGPAYLAAMVKDHTEVLSLIDDQLLKTAADEGVKKHLADTREHVATHLEKAKQLAAAR